MGEWGLILEKAISHQLQSYFFKLSFPTQLLSQRKRELESVLRIVIWHWILSNFRVYILQFTVTNFTSALEALYYFVLQMTFLGTVPTWLKIKKSIFPALYLFLLEIILFQLVCFYPCIS